MIYLTSETRMPVEQMVSNRSTSRSRPLAWAVETRRSYSSRVSSLLSSRNSRRWMRRVFTTQSCHPKKPRNRLSDTSMVLTVPGR